MAGVAIMRECCRRIPWERHRTAFKNLNHVPPPKVNAFVNVFVFHGAGADHVMNTGNTPRFCMSLEKDVSMGTARQSIDGEKY